MTPETITDEVERMEVYKFLVRLRDSGITNMWGATPYIQQTFIELSEKEAKTYHADWIRSFNLPKEQQPQDGR